MRTEIGKCSICSLEYEEYGRNAWPINDGICCRRCDEEVVIPERIKQAYEAAACQMVQNWLKTSKRIRPTQQVGPSN